MKLRMYDADCINPFHPIVSDEEMYLARKENREPIPFTYGFKITLAGANTLTPEEMEKMKLFLEENVYFDVIFEKTEKYKIQLNLYEKMLKQEEDEWE